MEFDFPSFLATVSIHIFYFYHLRDIFHNVHQSIDLVDLNTINYLLLEKLT